MGTSSSSYFRLYGGELKWSRIPLFTLLMLRFCTCALIATLSLSGSLACNVTIQHVKSGTCSSSRFGCGPSSLSPRSMFTKRGCCGVFLCDGIQTSCCSHSHAVTTYCACGQVPTPRPGGTFYGKHACMRKKLHR